MIGSDRTQPGQAQQATPALEYARRLKFHQQDSERRQKQLVWAGNAKVAVVIAILVLFWTIGKLGKPSWVWLIAAIAFLIFLVVWHRRILHAKNRAARAIQLYSRGIARLEDRWSGTEDTGEEFSSPDHLYAEDLDIFGQGSLFQLLSTARSRMGKKRLADWLLTQADAVEVTDRQQAVSELQNNVDLRERLALAGDQE